MKSLVSYFLALCFTLLAAPLSAQDNPFSQALQQQNRFLPVDQAFQLDFYQNDSELRVIFDIADRYYMYQHRFSFAPAELIHQVREFPEGIDHSDEFFGDTVIYRDRVELIVDLATARRNETLTVTFQGCADDGFCYAPASKTIYLRATSGAGPGGGDAYALADFSEQSSVRSQSGLFRLLESEHLLWTTGLFFLLGIGLAFTPCVFPMYPIISGIIMGQQRPLSLRKGLLISFVYVQGMAITYTALGILVALAGMQYQAMLQHPAILGVLAALFVIFALAMFNLIPFDVPQSVKAKLTALTQNQRGGAYPSVFGMGAVSGLIASPCTTAPLSGALLFIAQSGDVMIGATVLYALSIGMGIPLLVIGATGGKYLPRSGPWMNTIKILFGILLLAVALFLLERLLPLKFAAWLWIVFFAGAGVGLVWAIRQQLRGAMRIIVMSAVCIAAVAGVLWQKPYVDGTFEARQLQFTQVTTLTELQAEITEANTRGEWVMLDLYADWCVACLELERYTFTDEGVQQALANVHTVKVDVTAVNATNTELLSYYQVLGLPTILFFSPQGEEQSQRRVTGFMPASEFEAHLKEMQNL
ncbi:MAG: protein-disulfide reductase DsbD [Idiomarina sp.]|nr:protein-disulfide reductase DsbD [Idiomarina sp.]